MRCLVLFACIPLLLKAAAPPPAYDADLFRRNAQVFSFHASFLYWWVEEGALDYALKMQKSAWGPSPSFAQGQFEKGEYSGDPGFRIAASFFRAPKEWEVWGQYTRLTATGFNSSGKPHPPSVFLTGTWPQITPAPLAGAQSHLHMNYNTAELLADRFFNPNPHLRLRFLGGALIAWIDQDWKIHYADSAGRGTTVRNRWKYIGGGFRVGTMVDWFWGADLYITALTTTGVVLGTYRNRAEQKANFQLAEGDNPSLPLRDATYRDVRPSFTAQAFLGPSWQKSFPKTRVEVFAGYELNAWFNLQEIYRSSSGAAFEAKETWINTGLIALHGATSRLTVDF